MLFTKITFQYYFTFKYYTLRVYCTICYFWGLLHLRLSLVFLGSCLPLFLHLFLNLETFSKFIKLSYEVKFCFVFDYKVGIICLFQILIMHFYLMFYLTIIFLVAKKVNFFPLKQTSQNRQNV